MALCLCRRQCSVICSRIARHEQGRSPCGHPQQIRWRHIQRHDPKSIRGEWQFSCSWIPLFHAEVVSRAWKKDCNSLQKCSIPEAGQLRGRGQRQRRGREATGNAAQSPEHWIQSLAAGHGYMYILRKFNRMFFFFLPGLIDQPFKSRRDSRSGYPPRLLQQGAEAGSDVKVYRWNQPFLGALFHLACSVHPGQQPVLLTSTQGDSGQQSWGWEHWKCGLWLCSLSLGWNTSIPCLHLQTISSQGNSSTCLWRKVSEKLPSDSLGTISIPCTVNLLSTGWQVNGEIDPGRADSLAERDFSFLLGPVKNTYHLLLFS